jgi:hypothetical protein
LASINCQVSAASVFTSNPCFTGLPAGNYCVKVKDTCTGCDTCICVVITQPTPITLIANSITACPCNSSINVIATGGTPCASGYTYQLFPGGLLQPSPTFNNLCAGCYTIKVTDCNGCTATIVKCVGPCGANPVAINLQMYIQGYYAGGNMMAPVMMNQGVSSNMNDCDTVLVELRTTTAPFSIVASTQAILHTNGNATALFTSVQYPFYYYIVVKHRTGVQTWSANPVLVSAPTTTSYNFSNAQNKAYGDNMIQVDPGVWAFYTGDVNQDENLDLSDLSIYESDVSNFIFGYHPTDINGDGSVDLLDAVELENNVLNFIYSSHP